MFRKKGIFSWFCAFLIGSACADAPINPRASDSDASSRSASPEIQSRRVISAGPTRIRVIGPTKVKANGERVATVLTAVRAAAPGGRAISTRSAIPVARARNAKNTAVSARAGKNTVSGINGMARSATARATAVFTDVTKIGSGYAACRESYATCMDQVCANANDEYRRCFCSDRFTKFRSIEESLDQAMILLQKFQDNNLNVVDKTEDEVKAMYSPTVGELAIKRDTSAASKALDEISNLLSGKSSKSAYSGTSNSLGILDLNFSTDLDDVWSTSIDSIFSSGTDMSSLEGTALFNAAQKQCVRLSQNMCSSDALFSMSRSSYNILITQDCNIYEKNLNKKRETVAQAVRMAEKYLREARLEEYRSHNSADVNECIAKVRNAIFADTACGENYKRCLDPTGAYINGATGAPIYSPRLFELEKTINLGGVDAMGKDILSQNAAYNKFLEGYRNYVTRELDTCRDIADFVWNEFKRNAIIEIAQAQSEKIEEVKSSCVDTMAECYDTQENALKNMDKNTATTAAALGRYTARDMCREKVIACAALYGDNTGTGCEFDNRGHLKNSSASCGLASLLNYVKAVDSLSVVDKCQKAVKEYLTKLCTPDDSTYSYPYNCRNMSFTGNEDDSMNLKGVVKRFAIQNCWDPADTTPNAERYYTGLDSQIQTSVDAMIREIREDVSETLADACRTAGGLWTRTEDPNGDLLSSFYSRAFGGDTSRTEWGWCYRNSASSACQMYEDMWPDEDEKVVTWDSETQTCILHEAWYKHKCSELGQGYYSGGVCYIAEW